MNQEEGSIRQYMLTGKKQALCIATVASNLDNFNRNNTDILLKLGYEVTLAANFHSSEDINSQKKTDAFAKEMRAKGVHIVNIDFARSIRKAAMHLKSFFQVKKLLKRRFDVIHCHSPVCAAIVRTAARTYRKKYGIKVFYTAHGFHFYTGAPIRNWLIFYPVEKWLSRYTDVLITINQEDYSRAFKKFHAGKTVYVPGTGVDIDKFDRAGKNREKKRREFGWKENDIVLLSAGELNANKNHKMALKILAGLKETENFANIQYCICGQGRLKNDLERMIKELGLEKQVHLLGFREDMADIYAASDIFLFLSKREGLPMAVMEAMAGGLPCIVSDIRGNRNLIRDHCGGYVIRLDNMQQWKQALLNLLADAELRAAYGENNKRRVRKFGRQKVSEELSRIYQQGYNERNSQ